MNKIRSIFTKDGTISGDMVKRVEVDEHIRPVLSLINTLRIYTPWWDPRLRFRTLRMSLRITICILLMQLSMTTMY